MARPNDNPKALYHLGLATKFLGATVLVFALVAAALTARATAQLERDLSDAFREKGAAIGLALAAAAERSAKGDPLIVQNTIEANRNHRGVAYIYVVDASGRAYGSTFVGPIPNNLLGTNAIAPGEGVSAEFTSTTDVEYAASDGQRVNAIDVAAPVARATLGVVHVGMNKNAIDAQVISLRVSMLVAGLVVGAGGLVVLFVAFLVLVIRPVKELTRVTDAIARRGDLTQPIRVRRSDEIGQLAATFAVMVDKLREIPTVIRESTELLATSVSRLGESATQQSQTVTRQAAALQQTQVTAQEIRQTSLLASQKAEAVLQYAERGDVLSRTGEDAVDQSLAALTAIRSQVEEIALRIQRLRDRTIQIGNVTQTVKDLADQSNMLALNAAIEAVRSGEHGKGFAVVAREMRSLADQSIQGTKQVREMIEDISAAIREAVAITDKGVQRIDSGLAQVKTSGETLAELSRIMKDNSLAVRQISAAVGQQNAGITQIFGAVSDQSKMMDDTVKRLAATDESLEALQAASKRLVMIVDQYRV